MAPISSKKYKNTKNASIISGQRIMHYIAHLFNPTLVSINILRCCFPNPYKVAFLPLGDTTKGKKKKNTSNDMQTTNFSIKTSGKVREGKCKTFTFPSVLMEKWIFV